MNDEADRTELLALLQIALELELATIPPYLVALLSIKLPRNRGAAERIRSVMIEEMLHMALVANVMNAVGGSPRLNAAASPSYPLTMTFRGKAFADRRFPVDLAPFSEAAIATFMELEKPLAKLPELGWLKAEIDVPAPTIGTFYAKIVEIIEALEANTPGTLFVGAPTRQLEGDYYWSGGGRLVAVTDLESAKAALALVIDQGEGAWSPQSAFVGRDVDDPFPIGHYFRFSEILHHRSYARGDDPLSVPTGPPIVVDYSAVYPIKTNARSTDYAAGSEAAKLNDTFNRLYTSMLMQIEEAFNGSPKTLYTAIMNGMHGLASVARALMRVPIDGDPDGKTACPTFEWIDIATTTDPGLK
ncbi:MAG: ferritin-like protein [Rhizobiaceae bacterium]